MRRVVPFLFLSAAVGCAPSVRPATPTVSAAAGVTTPVDRLRIESIEASRRVAARIERVAEAIQDSTDDAEIWRNAQLWKVNGTQAAQDAGFRFEPLVSLLDLYALTVQQEQFLTRPPGDTMFGPWQGLAIQGARHMRTDLRQYLETILPPDRNARLLDTVEAWATRFPVTTSQFARYTVEGAAARLIDANETSVFSAVGSMEQTVRTLDGRVAALQQNLAKQVRWQAELLGREMLPAADKDSIIRDLGTTARSLEVLAATVDELPELVTSERIAVMEVLDRERALVMAALVMERMAVTAALASGRDSILAAVDSQRRAFLVDLEEATMRVKAATMAEVAEVLDNAIKKVALFIVLPFLLGIALLILAIAWILRPRSP